MRIAIDLDEVLAEFLQALMEYHGVVTGSSYSKQDFHSYLFWEVWGGTREETTQLVHHFHQTHYFDKIKVVDDAVDALAELKKAHRLFLVTSRQNTVKEQTLRWLEVHFPNTFESIHFGNHFSQSGRSISKKEICDQLKIDVLTEDSLEYASECASVSRKVFLMDKPWNQCAGLPNNIQRVHNWRNILEELGA